MSVHVEYRNDAGAADPNGLNFVCLIPTEPGTSMIIKQEFLRLNCAKGTCTYTARFQRPDGSEVGNYSADTARYDANNQPPNQDFREIPKGTRQVLIEGRRSAAVAVVGVRVLPVV